jgi:hypothetical protein
MGGMPRSDQRFGPDWGFDKIHSQREELENQTCDGGSKQDQLATARGTTPQSAIDQLQQCFEEAKGIVSTMVTKLVENGDRSKAILDRISLPTKVQCRLK